MDDKTLGRIGYVASIVGAIAALVYMVRDALPVQVVAGSPGLPGAGGAAGVAGMAGVPGRPGAPGIPGAAGAPGSVETYDAGTPSISTLNQYFVSQFFPPQSADQLRPGVLTFNAPPVADLGKQYMGIAADENRPVKSGGCGCGGKKKSCGGGSADCPNAAPPFRFTDGAGGCLSSSYGRLVESMEKCRHGFADAALKNIASTVLYYGYDTPVNAAQLADTINFIGSRSAVLLDFELLPAGHGLVS